MAGDQEGARPPQPRLQVKLVFRAHMLKLRRAGRSCALSTAPGEELADAETSKRYVQLVDRHGRTAGVESLEFDADAERLRHDPPMRWIVGGMAAHESPSQMGQFETRWLAAA